jgi:hypothetical protein
MQEQHPRGSTPSVIADQVQDDPEARALLQGAHAKMYKWPATFAGYQAALEVNDDGRVFSGEVTVLPRPSVVVQLAADTTLQQWVRERLETQARHLVYTSFAAGDGRYMLTFDHTAEATDRHPRGRRIALHGGPMTSWYRVAEERYTQISRTIPGQHRQVNTIERYESAPDGRLYACQYVLAYFRGPELALADLEIYHNTFLVTDGLLLPGQRVISAIDQSTVRTRQLTLSRHRLLG